MALPLNQGTVTYGTPSLTIPTGGSAVYICESFAPDSSTFEILRMNATGVVDGRVIGEEPIKGTATLLYNATTTTPPAAGDLFVAPVGGDSVNAVVTSVGESRGQREMTKCTINWVEAIA